MEITPKEMLVDPKTQVWCVFYHTPGPSFKQVEALPGVMYADGGSKMDFFRIRFFVDPKVTTIEEVIHALHPGSDVLSEPIIEVSQRSIPEGWLQEEMNSGM